MKSIFRYLLTDARKINRYECIVWAWANTNTSTHTHPYSYKHINTTIYTGGQINRVQSWSTFPVLLRKFICPPARLNTCNTSYFAEDHLGFARLLFFSQIKNKNLMYSFFVFFFSRFFFVAGVFPVLDDNLLRTSQYNARSFCMK